MEAVLNFRERLNNAINLLQEIALLKGEETQINENARNNNSFFKGFEDYIKLVNSYSVITKFDSFCIEKQDKDEMVRLNNIVKNTFSTKQVKAPIQFQNAVKRMDDKLKLSWIDFTDTLINDKMEQLEIFGLVCNNRKEIRDLVVAIKSIKYWPLTAVDYDRYINNISAANDQIEKIHFDVEIEEFLRKIKDKSATLLDLNDKILAWIKENKLNGNIMLGIRM